MQLQVVTFSAVKDGNENYVLNGEKWFSSAASSADIALVMAKTDPDAPRHQQFSTFLVELPNPGYRIKRDIPTMAAEGPLSHIMGGGHAEIEIKDLVVPAENLLGGEGQGVRAPDTAARSGHDDDPAVDYSHALGSST